MPWWDEVERRWDERRRMRNLKFLPEQKTNPTGKFELRGAGLYLCLPHLEFRKTGNFCRVEFFVVDLIMFEKYKQTKKLLQNCARGTNFCACCWFKHGNKWRERKNVKRFGPVFFLLSCLCFVRASQCFIFSCVLCCVHSESRNSTVRFIATFPLLPGVPVSFFIFSLLFIHKLHGEKSLCPNGTRSTNKLRVMSVGKCCFETVRNRKEEREEEERREVQERRHNTYSAFHSASVCLCLVAVALNTTPFTIRGHSIFVIFFSSGSKPEHTKENWWEPLPVPNCGVSSLIYCLFVFAAPFFHILNPLHISWTNKCLIIYCL